VRLVRDLDLQLDMAFVLWCQGEDPSGRVSEQQQIDLNRELVLESRPLLKPSILYDIFPLAEVRDQTVVLQGGASFRGHLLADRFGLAEEVALGLCTIGGDLEARVVAYRDAGDEVRAILLDGIGTAAIGELGEHGHAVVREQAQQRGWKASAAFQPGQLDWPLEDHRVFFDLLPAEKLGLQLDVQHLMVPYKSVSMAVGLGREMLPLAFDPACKYCPLAEDCRFSRE
jgi:cobalamin-dependent methionine synthase I